MKQFHQKKSLGQHFLKDRNIVRKIVNLADLTKSDEVWEIGPGKGILTEELLNQAGRVTCFEIDPRLNNFLTTKFGDKIELVQADILQIDWKKYFPLKPIKIVANLPYQITSPFLFRIVDHIDHFSRIVVMIQKEVAERIKAQPGSKNYGILSLKLQFYLQVKYGFTVKPHLFFPPPKVESAVIVLTPRIERPELENRELFWKLVQTCFRNRRKMLRRNLRYLFNKNEIERIGKVSGIALTARAEELTEADFIKLYKSLFLEDILVEHVHLIESTPQSEGKS